MFRHQFAINPSINLIPLIHDSNIHLFEMIRNSLDHDKIKLLFIASHEKGALMIAEKLQSNINIPNLLTMDKFILNDEERKYLGYPMNYRENMYFAKKSVDLSKVFYLDCEMVKTENSTNVVKIAWGNKEDSYCLLVKPNENVTDYITEITGVDETTEFTYTFDEAIDIFQQSISPMDVLVGHHMYNDLIALNFFHEKVIDTCMIFHHPDGPPNYYSLKYLAKTHLQRLIQVDKHDPTEDGMATYDLIEFCIMNGYVKTMWDNINQKFVPTFDLVLSAIGIEKHQLYCLFARGSRAIGTYNQHSDYDYVAVCNDNSHIVNGTLIRYGNIDICIYIRDFFEQYLRDQIIWALEAIYCPIHLILYETIDFRTYIERYRQQHKTQCDVNLLASVGYEANRKISAAKKQYMIGNYYQSKKYLFIAIRFVEFATQIVTHGKIINISGSNHHWDIIKEYSNDLTLEQYKILWGPIYRKSYRILSKSTIKISQNISNPHDSTKKCFTKEIQPKPLLKFEDFQNIQGTTTLSKITTAVEQLRDYLRVNSLDQLHREYSISAYKSKDNPQLILFRYDSHKAPESVFRYICRGIILDSGCDWKVVSYPFNNFILMKQLNQTPVVVHEKIDGSFCHMYFYEGKWCVSSNRSIDGTAIIGIRRKLKIIFRDLFWEIFRQKYNHIALNIDYTYMFEMISPRHPIIICYDEDNLVLIGVRNRVTYQEYSIYDSQFNDFTRPTIYPDLNTYHLDANLHEGMVGVTQDFERVKQKTTIYVKKTYKFPLCSNRQGASITHAIVSVLQSGEKEEFLQYCPEFVPKFLEIEKKYQNMKAKITEIYIDRKKRMKIEYNNVISRKIFASSLKEFPNQFHKYLYALFNGYDLDSYISTLNLKQLEKDIFYISIFI